MVTTFLDRLGGLVSRQFVVAYFVPVLVFSFLNALLLGWQVEAFRRWLPVQFEGFKGFYAVPVMIGLAVIAYLLFSINVYLRQVLEGARLLPDPVLRALKAREQARHDALMAEYRKNRDEFYAVSGAGLKWRQQLVTAGDAGNKTPVSGAVYGDTEMEEVKLVDILIQRGRGEPIPSSALEAAVTALSKFLAKVDRGSNARLNADYLEMQDLIPYAERAWDARRLASLSMLDTRFSVQEVRPTRMGNVAAALDNYAHTRYRMHLETFWNRMQPVLQGNEKFYGMLVEAKTQLDFLVLSCWLCIFTAMAWLVAMPWLQFSWAFYLTVALLAPALARLFYEIAVENYLTFADIVKSAVDLFRFDLLKRLHVASPTSLRHERTLWSSLQDVSTFGKEGSEISYQHDGA